MEIKRGKTDRKNRYPQTLSQTRNMLDALETRKLKVYVRKVVA